MARRWSMHLDSIAFFKHEIESIRESTTQALRNEEFMNLKIFQDKASSLKTKIEESEIFSKYLRHKEFNLLREKELISRRAQLNYENQEDLDVFCIQDRKNFSQQTLETYCNKLQSNL